MDKLQLNYNEYLRYVFAGGFAIMCFVFLNFEKLTPFFQEKELDSYAFSILILCVLLGSFLYSIHRAIFYPILCLKVNLIFLKLFRKIKKPPKWSELLLENEFIINEDFRRWHRRKNENSFSKNMLDWYSQIHYLYCCSWAMFLTGFFSLEQIKAPNILREYWWLFSFILYIFSLRSHYRSFLFDFKIDKKDRKYNKKSAS
jgi:hypothetical protein